MKKKTAIITLALAMTFTLVACGEKEEPSTNQTEQGETQNKSSEVAQTPDLNGEWEQVNGASEENFQVATIQGETIEIYWYEPAIDTKSLYWAGTYQAPQTSDTPYTWDSTNDTTKTEIALLASPSPTKTFTYQDNQISYEVEAMGMKQTVKLEKK